MSKFLPIFTAYESRGHTLVAAALGLATAIGIVTVARTQSLLPNNSYWIPPPEYDHPYTAGPIIVTRGDEKLMSQLCPKTTLPVTLGCRIHLSSTTPSPVCFIVIAKDELIEGLGWKYEHVKRHEIAHCNGWAADHKGARSVDGRVKPEARYDIR